MYTYIYVCRVFQNQLPSSVWEPRSVCIYIYIYTCHTFIYLCHSLSLDVSLKVAGEERRRVKVSVIVCVCVIHRAWCETFSHSQIWPTDLHLGMATMGSVLGNKDLPRLVFVRCGPFGLLLHSSMVAGGQYALRARKTAYSRYFDCP